MTTRRKVGDPLLHFPGDSHIVSNFCTQQSLTTTPFLPPTPNIYWHWEKKVKGLREEEHGAKFIKAIRETQNGPQYLCQWTDLPLFYRACLCFDSKSSSDGEEEAHGCILTLCLQFLEIIHFCSFQSMLQLAEQ